MVGVRLARYDVVVLELDDSLDDDEHEGVAGEREHHGIGPPSRRILVAAVVGPSTPGLGSRRLADHVKARDTGVGCQARTKSDGLDQEQLFGPPAEPHHGTRRQPGQHGASRRAQLDQTQDAARVLRREQFLGHGRILHHDLRASRQSVVCGRVSAPNDTNSVNKSSKT